jgi:hypothetical protein
LGGREGVVRMALGAGGSPAAAVSQGAARR